MLVPLVLRSIVLPYLRSTTLASTSTAAGHVVAIAGTARVLSTTTARRKPAEAVLFQDQDDALRRAGWRSVRVEREARDPQHYDSHPPPPAKPPTTHGVPRAQLPIARKRTTNTTSPPDAPPRAKDVEAPPPPTTATASEPVSAKVTATRDVFDRTPGAPSFDIPPVIDKLLGAKLYRMTVFHLISTPEFLADVQLVEYVIRRLEKKGAGKLAARLRRTLDQWTLIPPEGREGVKPRLLPEERKSSERRPTTYWRQPVLPRHPSEYSGTPAERRTHYINHRITAYLTVQHPAPYACLPLSRDVHGMKPPPPKLSRVQDVLKLIEQLRRSKNFVPDRVTVNIVVKAWLMSLSNQRDWNRLPLAARQRDLCDIFRIIVSSIESGTQPILFTATPGSDPLMPFDGAIEYDRHIKPLTKLISRALKRAGDRDARAAVRRWDEEMRVKLEKERLEREIRERLKAGSGDANAEDEVLSTEPKEETEA